MDCIDRIDGNNLHKMTEKLVNTIREFVEIPDSEMDKLLQIVKPTSWQAGGHFIREGQNQEKNGAH